MAKNNKTTDLGKGDPYSLLVGLLTGPAPLEMLKINLPHDPGILLLAQRI